MTIKTISSPNWRDIHIGDYVYLGGAHDTEVRAEGRVTRFIAGTGVVIGGLSMFYEGQWDLVRIEREEPPLKPGLYRINNSNRFIMVDSNGVQHLSNGVPTTPYLDDDLSDGPYELKADTINEVVEYLRSDGRSGSAAVVRNHFKQDNPC